MNPQAFSTRRVDPEEYRDVLLDLMSRNLQLPEPDQRWQWVHHDNPDGKPLAWLLYHKGDPVASCTGIPRSYRHPNGKRTALILADVNSDPEFRFALPAITLQRKIRDDFLGGKVEGDFLLCGPIPSLGVVQRRAGMKYLGASTRWSKPISIKKLRRHGRPYSMPIAIAADAVLASKRMLRFGSTKNVELLREPIGADFDQLESFLDSHTDRFRPARSSSFLRWRFESHPFYDHSILTLRRNGQLQGYAVLNSRHDGVQMIVDMRVPTARDFKTMLLAAERHAHQSGAGALWINLVDNSPYLDLVKSAGFKPRSKPMQVTAMWPDDSDCKLNSGKLMDCDFDV